MITAKIIADSISPSGKRITTFVLEMPRFILAELNTHRMFSRNSASSRAIPISKMIYDVYSNPAVPVHFGQNQKGMQAKHELTGLRRYLVKKLWYLSRYPAIAAAYSMEKLGAHKQVANRILEPWFMMRTILTGTDFDNFFVLRCHPDAQPEIRVLAEAMLAEYKKSIPVLKKVGEWHMPFGDNITASDWDLYNLAYDGTSSKEDLFRSYSLSPAEVLTDIRCRIAIARCARVSYLTHGTSVPNYKNDLSLCKRLFGSYPRHLSPAEHIAQCMDNDSYIGNFAGWLQYRKQFPDENAALV